MNHHQNTPEQILSYLKQKGPARVEDLRRETGLTRAMIHRHLNKLIHRGLLTKAGKPPTVFYTYSPPPTSAKTPPSRVSTHVKSFIDKNFLYISPQGQTIPGFNGFIKWAKQTNPKHPFGNLAKEYIQVKTQANQHFGPDNLIDATNKIKNTFPDCALKKVYYADFYTLPKFGKTILGQQVLHAKQAQSERLIKQISQHVESLLIKLIAKHHIQAVGFIPPTIPRKIQFQKEFQHHLAIDLPQIKFAKAYPGDIPVAQKSLNQLEERVKNARDTIFIKTPEINFKSILLIDDAVGSGATLNETAKKLRKFPKAKHIYGFAVVGSYKGFDVIREI
jgi:phosphoribosylpyrophosphate synthetase